jgi:hypothetical protein
MTFTKLLKVLLQVIRRRQGSSPISVHKGLVQKLPERPLGHRLMHPSIFRLEVDLDLHRAMNRAQVSIKNPETPDERQGKKAGQAIVPDSRLIAESSSASGLVGGLPPSVGNGIEILPAHRRDEGAQFIESVKVAIEISNQERWMVSVVKSLSHASLQDGRGEPGLLGVQSSSTVAIDIEDRKDLAMAPHSKPQVDRSATISEFLKCRFNGFELEECVA